MLGLNLGLSLARPPLIVPGGGGGGGGPYAVNGVRFDGTNDYISRGGALTGQTSHAAMIGSIWFLADSDGANLYLGRGRQATESSRPIEMNRTSSNKVRIILRNAANNIRVHWESDNTVLAASGWNHLLFGINLVATPVAKFYLNDVAQGAPLTGPTTDDIAWGSLTNFFLGSDSTAGNKWLGDMAEFYLNNGEYLDFATESNRRKFIDASGYPVDLGADGSTPTGTAPIIFQEGATAAWHTNKGSGGGFTESGALTDAATSPSD